jgi:beta-ribofuranosylaminobenzene 5'-phosphate synthase
MLQLDCPARIHIDLIEMSGSLSRINGSLGFAVAAPVLTLTAMPGAIDEVVWAASSRDPEDADEICHYANELKFAKDKLELTGGVTLSLAAIPPRHSGLGSGTQSRLGVLALLNAVFSCGLTDADLIACSGRGRTSGLGCHLFQVGGFAVDGGRHKPTGQTVFQPSRFAGPAPTPPLLFQRAMPSDWGVAIVLPLQFRGLSGLAESGFMQRATPVPPAECAAVCHHVLMETLPSLVEHDFDGFVGSIDRLQTVGWKSRHWARDDLRGLTAIAIAMREAGVRGVGLSSTGPALFGFYPRDPAFKLDGAIRERMAGVAGRLILTEVSNQGRQIRSLA